MSLFYCHCNGDNYKQLPSMKLSLNPIVSQIMKLPTDNDKADE